MDNATAKILSVSGDDFNDAKVCVQFVSVDGVTNAIDITPGAAALIATTLLNEAQRSIHPLARVMGLISGCSNIQQLQKLTGAVFEPGRGVYFERKQT